MKIIFILLLSLFVVKEAYAGSKCPGGEISQIKSEGVRSAVSLWFSATTNKYYMGTKVYKAVNNEGGEFRYIGISDRDSLNYEDKNVSQGNCYYYKITWSFDAGSEQCESEMSVPAKICL